jgi:predicted enzyme related to lactoylglutathione lyase
MPLGDDQVVAFVPTTNLDRAAGFYSSVLHLPLEEHSSFACVFRAGGTMLRVTLVDALRVQPFTVFGWDVTDIAKTMAALTERGVVFERFDGMGQDDTGVWTTPRGDRVAWFKDPDGNTLSLTQFGAPRSRPSTN